jgi:lysyl-tRNA synthetase class 2
LRRNETEAEVKLWSRLRDRRLDGWRFKRQVPKGRYIVDFCCAEARLIVELDGSRHADSDSVAHDADRTRFLQESGFRVIRFWNGEVFTNLDGVIQTIWAKLQEPPLPDFMPHSIYPAGRGLG